jgi:hypothetical protein
VTTGQAGDDDIEQAVDRGGLLAVVMEAQRPSIMRTASPCVAAAPRRRLLRLALGQRTVAT